MDKNKSIKELLKELENKKILLPEFQRNFTWSIEQTVDLFDSISRNIFIGALILSKPKFALTCREIDKRPRKGRGKNAIIDISHFKQREFDDRNIYVLLDGQQRATSMFRALNGIGGDEIYFVFKDMKDLPLQGTPIESLEQIINGFSSKQDSNCFSVSVSQIFSADTSWFEEDVKKKIFNPTVEHYPDLTEEDKELYFKMLLHLRAIFHKILDDKTLLSVFLLDMDLEKFCMFFERSNSKGVVLNFIDIITAKIYKGFNLRQKKEDFKDKYNDKSIDDNQIVEAFVRYLSFLEKELVDKKTILESLDDSHFNKHWDEICKLYIKSKSTLSEQQMIFDIERLPNKTMFIPLMHFINCLPNKDFSQATLAQQKFLKFWFWSSMLNTRYGGGMVGSTNNIIVEDCKLLEKVASNKPIKKEFLKKFKLDFHQQELYDLTSNKGAIFIGVMSLLNYKEPFKELANDGLINFKDDINIHHIFPKKYIEDTFESDSFEAENVDSILNKMIIGKISNIKFGKKPPSTYLTQDPLDKNTRIKNSLESHLIPCPEDLINGKFDLNFKKFLEERYKLMSNLLQKEIIEARDTLLQELEEEQVEFN